MPRTKNAARRPQNLPQMMPFELPIDVPVEIPIETSPSYDEAQRCGAFLGGAFLGGAFIGAMEILVEVCPSVDEDYSCAMEIPLEIPVDIDSVKDEETEIPSDIPVDIPIQTSSSYDDARSSGALLMRIGIPVEVCTCVDEAFLPLCTEEETMVRRILSMNDSNILVEHRDSNIAITGRTLGCLKPREWLNDEVINLYLILLKEREIREPSKHLKCHFFNTFFFTKLAKSETGYNYGSVRRWTSMKKLGYHLKDCEKIFVPIPMDLHWTLVVVNSKDRKFQYLDSFKGYQSSENMDVVARYYVDELSDKNHVNVDISGWTKEFVHDLPAQNNGFDCGMFIMKYMDFYSKGMDLCFSQEHMAYFRMRTAKEILHLRAD